MAKSAEFPAVGPADAHPAAQRPDAVGETPVAVPSAGPVATTDPGSVTPGDSPAPHDGTDPGAIGAVEVLQAEEIRAAPAWLATLRRVWGRAEPGVAEGASAHAGGSHSSTADTASHGLDGPDTLAIVEVVAEATEDPHAEPASTDQAAGHQDQPDSAQQPAPHQAGGHHGEVHHRPDVIARERLLAGLTGLAQENDGPGAAAFFDVDNTTIRGSSFVALAKGMADRDYFTTSEIMAMSWKQLKFVVSGTENLDDIAEATENGLQFVKGRQVTEIQTISDEVYDEKLVNRLWAGTLALTEAHLAAGHQVWLVSATPQEVAEVLAARLGLTGGLGTVAEVVDGRYTGKLQGGPLHGQAKAKVVAELAGTHGLDLKRCSAYSDSANDIPMLSIVGHPVAINPDSKLRAYAREQGWPIRDYRFRGKESVRKGLPAAAAAGLIAGAAVGVAVGVSSIRGRSQ